MTSCIRRKTVSSLQAYFNSTSSSYMFITGSIVPLANDLHLVVAISAFSVVLAGTMIVRTGRSKQTLILLLLARILLQPPLQLTMSTLKAQTSA